MYSYESSYKFCPTTELRAHRFKPQRKRAKQEYYPPFPHVPRAQVALLGCLAVSRITCPMAICPWRTFRPVNPLRRSVTTAQPRRLLSQHLPQIRNIIPSRLELTSSASSDGTHTIRHGIHQMKRVLPSCVTHRL